MESKTYKRYTNMALMAFVASMIVFALGVGTISSAQNAKTRRSKPVKSSTGDADSVGTANQQASVDPQTGKLRQPTREEAQKLADEMKKKFSRAPEKVTIVQQADGTVMAELPEEYMDVMVVKKNPDGTISMECVTGVKAADALVSADANASGKAVANTTTEAKDKKSNPEAGRKE